VDEGSDAGQVLTLVYPREEDPGRGRVSVLSPAGAAFLGRSVGETLRWWEERGPRVLTVIRMLYQPEAAGDPRG
jgi:regulator of nucleoside diphosphate kinase